MVLAICFVLKSPIGLGTVLTVVFTGMIMDLVFKIVKFDPRTVVHEGLIETAAALTSALKEKK